MANPFVHVELNTPDPDKAKAFYSKLFQWQLEDMPIQPCRTARTPWSGWDWAQRAGL
jgi:predicted enzyme related to lactoylglutathione lyase